MCPDGPVREPERKPSECAVLKGVHPLRKSLKAQITAASDKTPHPANTTSSVERGKICGGLGGLSESLGGTRNHPAPRQHCPSSPLPRHASCVRDQ